MKSFVDVDLGASSTRYTSDSGVISIIPNNMVTLPTMEQSLITPDSNDIESCLEVQIVKNDADTLGYFPTNVLIGIMADKHRNINERPNVMTHKHTQKINYVSAIVAVALSKLKFDLSDNINLYLATPPIEVHLAEKVFNESLTGKYTVTFPKYMDSPSVTFTIDQVKCYEESYMSLTSFFFNMNGTLKECNKSIMSGTTLSVDIGASTTDLAITKNGRYMDKTGQTYRIGGNVARDNLVDLICERFAIDLPIEDAERVMAEGRLQQGNTFVDVSDLVNIAKADLAKQLIQYMQTYFKRVDTPIQMVNNIVVSGGGSAQSQYINDNGEIVKTSEPMSYYVTQELLTWSPGTVVVAYGEEARLANVKGLFIRSKVDAIKMAKEETKNTVIPQAQAQAQTQSQPVVPTPQAQTQPVVSTPQAQTQAQSVVPTPQAETV